MVSGSPTLQVPCVSGSNKVDVDSCGSSPASHCKQILLRRVQQTSAFYVPWQSPCLCAQVARWSRVFQHALKPAKSVSLEAAQLRSRLVSSSSLPCSSSPAVMTSSALNDASDCRSTVLNNAAKQCYKLISLKIAPTDPHIHWPA